jgi:DNA invertase Pin-like site-specific DNA recombinase
METQTNDTGVPELKYCLYTRKSSESDERQALSIDSQIKEMLTMAQREHLNVIDIKRESHSAKDTGQRPVFNQMIGDIRTGKFNAILAWHPDRLSRNAGDLGTIVDLMDQKAIVEVRTYGQKFTNNPSEKFLFMILGSQAKLENDNKSVNVKRGLRTKVEMGLWPSVAPTGYLNTTDRTKKGHVDIDPNRSHIIRMMFEKVAYEGWSGRKIFRWLLQDVRFTSRNNKPLTLSNVHTILQNAFYSGMIEYPRGSGKWYAGKHEPIISQELYKKVREKMSLANHAAKSNKEFAFTRLLHCGMCKSGVSAQEKFKNLSDGTVVKYIYYGCTRFTDKQCKNQYLREEELINQLVEILDKIDLNMLGVRQKLEKEMERFSEFRSKVLGMTDEEKATQKKTDLRSYAKYLLKDGTLQEKRELMQSFKSRLMMINKRVILE